MYNELSFNSVINIVAAGRWIATLTIMCWTLVVGRQLLQDRARLGPRLLAAAQGYMSLGAAVTLGIKYHSGHAFWQRLTKHDEGSGVSETDPALISRLSACLQSFMAAWLLRSPSIVWLSRALPALALGALVLWCVSPGSRRSRALLAGAFLCGAARHLLEAGSGGGSGDASMPLRQLFKNEQLHALFDLLPPTVWAKAGLTLAGAVACSALLLPSPRLRSGIPARSTHGSLPAAALLASLTLVSSPRACWALALLFLAVDALRRLNTSGGRAQTADSARWGCSAAYLSCLSLLAFFCTGHVPEFAGIVWTAGNWVLSRLEGGIT